MIEQKINWKLYFFEPVSAFSLGIFRVLWGSLMCYYFLTLALGGGKELYLDTIFQFKYPLFEWVERLPNPLMYLCFYSGVLSALLVALGLFFKTASKVLFVVFVYVFLLDLSYWNNHYYAYALINAFFVVTDAHKSCSLDKKRLQLDDSIPRWQLLLFRFQFMLIYFYGGLSKLQNKDWMSNLSSYSLLQNNLSSYKLGHSIIYPLSIFITWGGLLYDLTVGFLLLWKRTLWWCLPAILLFNFFNSFLFNIGTFPYAMIASFVLFVPAKELATKIEKWTKKPVHYKKAALSQDSSITQTLILLGLSIYISFQLLFPLRSLFYKGSVFWTAEGKLYAWHMMAASTYVEAQDFTLVEYDEKKKVVLKREPIDASRFLSKKQMRTMGTFPYVIPQFAKFLKKEATAAGFKNFAITGKIYISKNYRPKMLIIDPDLDLTSLEVKHFQHNNWLLRYDTEDGYFGK